MKTLIVLLGPTGTGKTELSLKLAENFNSPIISADSRQLYEGLTIGTAAPTITEQNKIKHYFIGNVPIVEPYNVSIYESQCIDLINKLFQKYDKLICVGGSMLYIDAICKGIDEIPDVSNEVREELWEEYQNNGIDDILKRLKLLDKHYYFEVDHKNHKRVIHGLEVCLTTGKPFSFFRKKTVKERTFNICKIGLERNRDDLFNRINKRVDQMITDGLLLEAKANFHNRHLNALNTVGYKELFAYIEGMYTLGEAIEKIKRNTRNYAKQQMRWFKKDDQIKWYNLTDYDKEYIIQDIVKSV